MANIASAKKRARQTEVRRRHNGSLRSLMRTAIKKVIKATTAKELNQAQEAYKQAVPIIDKMKSKGIIHANKANRYKSRLNTRVKTLAL